MATPLFQTVPLQHAFGQDQLYLVLYLDQAYGGDRINQETVIKSEFENNFGLTAVNDWPLYDGPDVTKATVVARARGHHIQSGKDEKEGQWFHTCNIVFTADSCHHGSTLVVIGTSIDERRQGEWAIVGGTGDFTLAQGAIYYDVVKINEGTGQLKKLHIGVFYKRMERSILSAMFTEFNPSEIDDSIEGKERLGSGGFGSVYKAVIRDMTVAVKIHNRQEERAFKQEVEILKSTRHENLVILVGACHKRLALVYEYLPNGTLEDRLSEERKGSFSWEKRVQVAISICSALEFLHNSKPKAIAHGDLKPSNILFDADDVCKLGDFGISRLLDYTTGQPKHITTDPKGTQDYVDPKFLQTRKLTPSSDIYALGIILLQLVTGQDAPKLREHVFQKLELFKNLREQKQMQMVLKHLVDKTLKIEDRFKLDTLKMLHLGLECSSDTSEERPDSTTEVRSEIESMRSSATGSGVNTIPLIEAIAGLSVQNLGQKQKSVIAREDQLPSWQMKTEL